MPKAKRYTAKLSELTHSQLKLIASKLGKTQSQVLSEYIRELFELMAIFNGSVNIRYDGSVLAETLTVSLDGASTLIVGSMPMPNAINEEVCDVAVSTVVESKFEKRKEK